MEIYKRDSKGGFTMRIKRFTQLSVSILVLFFVLMGCTNEKKETTPSTETVKEQESTSTLKPLLYEVKHGNATVYLYGTMHIGKESYYPLPSYAEKAFTKSDALVTEINMNELTAYSPLDPSKGLYKNGETIEDHLSKKAIEHLKKIVPEYGINYEEAKLMNPGMLSMNLTVLPEGYLFKYGLDKYFTKKADETNKKILTLETIQFQEDLMFNTPFTKEEADEEILALKPRTEAITASRQLTTYVEMGDAENLGKFFIDSMTKKQYKSMIYDRNVNMTTKVEEYLKTNKTYFVAVGAGHVIGKDGMVEILKKKGYSPTRVEK
jgi:uncharacterized protein